MLKLKKLQVLGFKSFCDRTELKFHGDGVAAIVGPNGCGKSNIADAISWVLGEQSAKSLRGSRMEDVIFAGSRDRQPTGMAEVSLTLIDPEVYAGPDKHEPTQVEVQEGLAEDWDEAELRARAQEETERAVEEAHPGRIEEGEPTASGGPDGVLSPESPDRGGVPSTASQVVLKIRRRKFQQQVPAGEIVVTRRLFRTGDSEYLLNGKLCRLRDIQELFMGTGLGPESYALIEQGRIGQILSSRPTDRRAIIEEAAGVTKFKTKKRLAEARLEESKLNLNRVNDIFEEVTRQMNSLKRQASKAERYARLRDQMRAKLRVVVASKFVHLDQESSELHAQLNAIGEQMQHQADAVGHLEAEHGERTQRGYAIDAESRQNRERLNQIAMETDRAQARRHTNEERCTELAARTASSEAELALAYQRLTALEQELAANQRVLDGAAAELGEAQTELELSRQEASAASATLSTLEAEIEQGRAFVMEAVSAAGNLRNQLTQTEERLASVDRESQRLLNEITAASSQVEVFGGQRGQLALEFETVSQRVSALSEEITGVRERLETRREEESEAKQRLDAMRSEYASLLGKKGSLEAVIAEHGYSTESVRRLFQSGALQGGLAPAGVLADFFEVVPQYERVVEDFLRDELNYIVVKSWDAADEGLRLLRSDVDGRATFLVHSDDSQARFSFPVDENAHPVPVHQSVVPLKNTIAVLNGFGRSLEVILPKLRDSYIVPDPGAGRDLALENPHAFFLAQSGECFHNVTVTGGKQRSEGPLSMKRELRDVARLLEDLERALHEHELKVLTLGREIKDLASLLDRLEGQKRDADKQAMTSGHLLRQLDADTARLQERLRVSRMEGDRLASERAEQGLLISSCQQEIADEEARRAALEEQIVVSQERLRILKACRDAAVQRATERAAKVAGLEERHRSASAGHQRIESLAVEVRERVYALRTQIDAFAAEKVQRENENVTVASQVVDFDAERNAGEAREGLLQFESRQIRARLAEIDEALRHARQSLDQARDRRGEIAAAAAKLQSDTQYLAETCLNELGVPRQELLADATIPIVAGEHLSWEDQAYREMYARLEAMGPVNMMALEEYKETSERHQFLETQRKDLLEAIENTLATIREIDTVSRQRFREAFEQINQNFQLTFRKLFGGGQALMRLTDEENSAESGIDIVASPPGKKLQNVLLLSGGEKALTALALLVGVFQYQPSPFCILDEVDAPLDEANIGRFTELVQEMSVGTQFVLITHSKKTMSIAPVLYGVTMQEPGISKLVSVRFGVSA